MRWSTYGSCLASCPGIFPLAATLLYRTQCLMRSCRCGSNCLTRMVSVRATSMTRPLRVSLIRGHWWGAPTPLDVRWGGVGAPHQCALGPIASYTIHADVQLHIRMTHNDDRCVHVAIASYTIHADVQLHIPMTHLNGRRRVGLNDRREEARMPQLYLGQIVWRNDVRRQRRRVRHSSSF